jgi:hypothetical protein
MKQRILVAAVAALVVAMPSFARAQVESTPIPAATKPNFSSMEFLVGTWTCRTKSSRRPAAYVTTATYAMDPTGYWLVETSSTATTSWVPTPLKTVDHITYDAYTKRWADVLTGDQGAYGLSFSKGWSGNDMVWHDVSFAPSADISAQSDTTMTKVSATKTTSSSTFTEGKTGRKVTVMGTCTKS